MTPEGRQNPERVARIAAVLQDEKLDAVICTLLENVLLMSGYWPVIGTSVVVATSEGKIVILAPADEDDLAHAGWADEVRTYAPGSLTSLEGPKEAVRPPLTQLLSDLGLSQARLGLEDGSGYSETSYAAVHLFGAGMRDIVTGAVPAATVASATTAIARLRSVITPPEVGQVRDACEIAGTAFTEGVLQLRPGLREPEVAELFAAPMMIRALAREGVQRAGAFTWCMSGENSALAGAAYARTRNRALRGGDFVLVHCNSYLDGYWTDITRTYCLGEPDERQQELYSAIFAARAAALATIGPGAAAADVDRAGRDVLVEHGYGKYFTHGIGHNVGFSAISGEFPPRLHPASTDYLEVGMTFNIEPAIYIAGYGGIRHCDVVTVIERGAQVLTPFGADLASLVAPL